MKVHVDPNVAKSIGMYHGNPIYWSDLMRIAPDHQTPGTVRFLWAIMRRINSLAYRINKREAKREMDRWGIEHPFFTSVPHKETPE